MKLLKPTEAAELLGVRRSTIYAWIKDNRIPSVRLSQRVVRVPLHALEAQIERLMGGEDR